MLYRGEDCVLTRPVNVEGDARETAEHWLRWVIGDTEGLTIAEPSRRRLKERRRIPRGGRRAVDRKGSAGEEEEYPAGDSPSDR